MTGYELRRHLAADHQIPTSGLTYEELSALHRSDHEVSQDHDHREMR